MSSDWCWPAAGPELSVRHRGHLLPLFAYGLDVPRDSPANFLPVDDAANFLNVLLAVAVIVLGIFLNRTISKVTTVVQAQA